MILNKLDFIFGALAELVEGDKKLLGEWDRSFFSLPFSFAMNFVDCGPASPVLTRLALSFKLHRQLCHFTVIQISFHVALWNSKVSTGFAIMNLSRYFFIIQ